MAQEQKVEYRIRMVNTPVIYLIAGLFDLLSLIPLANMVTLFIGQFMMWFMFGRYKVDTLDKKNWLWYVATWVCELVWPISVLPMFLFSAQRMIFISRRQDEINSSALSRAGAAAILKSEQGKEMRNKMRTDRLQEKNTQPADFEKGGANANTVKNARESRDVFRAPREERQMQQRQKEKETKSETPTPVNDNFSGVKEEAEAA